MVAREEEGRDTGEVWQTSASTQEGCPDGHTCHRVSEMLNKRMRVRSLEFRDNSGLSDYLLERSYLLFGYCEICRRS